MTCRDSTESSVIKTINNHIMPKTAILACFTVRTRVIVDIPDNTTKNEFLNSNQCTDIVTQLARKNILSFPEDYMCGDNIDFEEDIECPFGTLPTDNDLSSAD